MINAKIDVSGSESAMTSGKASVMPSERRPMVIIRMQQLREKTGLSRSTIYARLDPSSSSYDPSFPKQVKLGPAAVGWIEAEVDEWLAGRAMQREDHSELSSSAKQRRH